MAGKGVKCRRKKTLNCSSSSRRESTRSRAAACVMRHTHADAIKIALSTRGMQEGRRRMGRHHLVTWRRIVGAREADATLAVTRVPLPSSHESRSRDSLSGDCARVHVCEILFTKSTRRSRRENHEKTREESFHTREARVIVCCSSHATKGDTCWRTRSEGRSCKTRAIRCALR